MSYKSCMRKARGAACKETSEAPARRTRRTRDRALPTQRAVGVAAVTAVVIASFPVSAAAQACLGDAALTAQFTLGGYAAFADEGKGYGADSRANLPNMVGMGARIGVIDLDDSDENITSVAGHLALDLGPRGAMSLCPVVEVEHDFWNGTSGGVELDYTRWAFPLGLAVGSRFGGAPGGPVLIPSARAGVIHQRFSGSATSGPFVFQREGNQSDFFLDAGATVHLGRIYARAAIQRIFQEEGDTVFQLRAGFVF